MKLQLKKRLNTSTETQPSGLAMNPAEACQIVLLNTLESYFSIYPYDLNFLATHFDSL